MWSIISIHTILGRHNNHMNETPMATQYRYNIKHLKVPINGKNTRNNHILSLINHLKHVNIGYMNGNKQNTPCYCRIPYLACTTLMLNTSLVLSTLVQ